METLAARSDYDSDELGITRRMPLVAGTFFGACMGLFALFEEITGGRPLGRALLTAGFTGLFAGALFGFFFPRLMRQAAGRLLDRLYSGDPRLVASPPGNEYAYRLPCSWMRSPRSAVGGVLYIGNRGLRFDPHLRTPPSQRTSLLIEPLPPWLSR